MTPAAAEWVAKAENDFASAQWEMRRPPTPNFDAVCFHAQQCIEKLMKAVLEERGIPIPKIHSLSKLSVAVSAAIPIWIFNPTDFGLLDPGAVQFRYPGANASMQDAADAIAAWTRLRASLLPLI